MTDPYLFFTCFGRPPEIFDSFVLNDKGVYYTSPMEWASSTIEMSMISAKNAALLAFNNWYEFDEKVDPGLEKPKGDAKKETEACSDNKEKSEMGKTDSKENF